MRAFRRGVLKLKEACTNCVSKYWSTLPQENLALFANRIQVVEDKLKDNSALSVQPLSSRGHTCNPIIRTSSPFLGKKDKETEEAEARHKGKATAVTWP